MAIEKINFDKCIGCGMCEKFCPVDVIRFSKEISKPEIKYPKDCMLCGLCEARCPVKAIEVTPSKSADLLTSWG